MNVPSDDKQMHGHTLTPLHLYKNISLYICSICHSDFSLECCPGIFVIYFNFFISLGPCCDQFTIGES